MSWWKQMTCRALRSQAALVCGRSSRGRFRKVGKSLSTFARKGDFLPDVTVASSYEWSKGRSMNHRRLYLYLDEMLVASGRVEYSFPDRYGMIARMSLRTALPFH
eukprot:6470805-Amphidinium_carterae.1